MMSVPPIGMSKTGVSMATPKAPYLLQIAMARLLFFEKVGLFLLNRSKNLLFIHLPKKVNSATLVIIPPIERAIVTKILNPARYPPEGPAKNLSVVRKNINIAFAMSNSVRFR